MSSRVRVRVKTITINQLVEVSLPGAIGAGGGAGAQPTQPEANRIFLRSRFLNQTPFSWSPEAMVGFLSFGDFGYLGFLVDGVSCRWTFTVRAKGGVVARMEGGVAARAKDGGEHHSSSVRF